MDPVIKAKWVEALRSGKYRKARGRLKHRGRFCCLGVLCEVVGVKPIRKDGEWFYKDQKTCLPRSVMRAAKIWTNDGSFRRRVEFAGSGHRDLANLNDAGADFNFIADVIKKQF